MEPEEVVVTINPPSQSTEISGSGFFMPKLRTTREHIAEAEDHNDKVNRTSGLQRIGVAIEADLLEQFDRLLSKRGYTNRSEAFRDLARAELVLESSEAPNARVVGSVTLVYNHHVRLLSEKLTELQHQHQHNVVSTLHVYLDHDYCLEVIVLRGKAQQVRELADALISTKGVKNGRLTIAEADSGETVEGHNYRREGGSARPSDHHGMPKVSRSVRAKSYKGARRQ
jgi:CopG family nickel-responsive transcriptional regulator